jgi:CRP/FNR family transcriptional regulator, cyclic AMP receptor protein
MRLWWLYGQAEANPYQRFATTLADTARGVAVMCTSFTAVDEMTTNASSKSQRLRSFLKSHTFFGGLPDAALDALVRKGHTKSYAKGDIIFRRGDPGDRLTVIVSGRIKIANVNANAKEVVLNFLEAGDINGEIAVLDGNERSANAVALEDSEVVVILGRDLMPVLVAHPQAMLEIMQILCQRLRAVSAIVEDSTLAMRGRVAKGLLRLARQHGRTSKDGIRLQLTLSQNDLGKYLALSRENVSRQLRYLRDAHVIRLEGAQVVIINETTLAALAESVSSH